MMRIEVRDYAKQHSVIAESTTDKVVSVTIGPAKKVVIGPSASDRSGRIFVVIPREGYDLLDITLNQPRDLMMVTVRSQEAR